MHIYGIQKYGQALYSKGNPVHKQGHLYYGSCIVGIEVRGQIGHKWIYRCRRGNGEANSFLGTRYQDRFTYFVPSSIMHPNGNASRACFALAVSSWAALPLEDKSVWDKKARRYKALPGRNLFIREYMKGNYR